MAVARRTWLFSLCLWLSLATVLGHALSPVSSPLTPKSGSAFSASTSDVSLGAPRAGIHAKLKRGQAADEEESGPPDLSAPLLLAEAPVLQARAPRGNSFSSVPASIPPPFGPGGGFNARAPPHA